MLAELTRKEVILILNGGKNLAGLNLTSLNLSGFNLANGILFALITLLMLFGSVVDNLIMGQKAREQGVEIDKPLPRMTTR